jgi:hypothetical protein
MGAEPYHAALEMHRQLGVVILPVCDEGYRIHEENGLVVIRKGEGLFNGHCGTIASQPPAFQYLTGARASFVL